MDCMLRRAEVTTLRQQALSQAAPPVLELGFGTGLNLACYPKCVREITAVDLHRPRLGFARKRIAEASVKVDFQLGDAARISLPDHSFATVVSTWFLCSVAQPAAVLAEIRRVLRPDGRYLFIEHGLSPHAPQRRLQNRLTPLTRFAACGCTLNRPIPALIQAAGLHLLTLQEHDLPSLGKASGHLFLGAAKT